MTDIFFYALAISVVFFLIKFLERKFQADDEKKQLKIVIKESAMVYSASVLGIYMYSQFDIKELKGGKNTMAFVDNPAF
jgi:hypothetical protein